MEIIALKKKKLRNMDPKWVSRSSCIIGDKPFLVNVHILYNKGFVVFSGGIK